MIIFLLLVIVAILLFGSSAVIGAAGMILSLIAGVFALVIALQIWDSLSLTAKLLLCGTPVVAIGLLYVLLRIMTLWSKKHPQPRVALDRKPVDTIWLAYDDDIASFSPEARAEAFRLYKAGRTKELEKFCLENKKQRFF